MGRKKRGTPMRRVNYFLTAEQIERIEALCLWTGLDRSAVIRLAIDAWLDRADRQHKKERDG